MMMRTEQLILYHGSYCEVSEPDLNKCARYKDFGQGFYLTTSEDQARRFSRTSLKKAASKGIIDPGQQYGVVSVFECPVAELDKLNVCEFSTADTEWLHCVVGHRKGRAFKEITEQYKNYDVIVGKIANDATNATITAYMSGIYGTVGSDRASEFCVSLLRPERLKDQYCFRTLRALGCLRFVRSEKIWK